MNASIKNQKSKIKNCFLLFLMMWLVPDIFGQQVEYVYDAAGNRKQRKVIAMKSNSQGETMTKSAVSDPDAGANANSNLAAVEKYEDMLGERKVTIYPNPTRGMIRIE